MSGTLALDTAASYGASSSYNAVMDAQFGDGPAAGSAGRFQDALANAARARNKDSSASYAVAAALAGATLATPATASSVSGLLGTAGDFFKGVGEGALDGAMGMVQGVSGLAQGAYSLATSADARQQAVGIVVQNAKAVGQFAKTTVIDPGTAAEQVSNAASGAWNQVSTAYQQAAAQGHGAEFIGKAFGQSAALVGTAVIPGGAEAEAAGLVGDAARVAQIAGSLGKAGEVGADVGKAGVGAGLDKATELTTNASKVGDAAAGTVTKGSETPALSEAGEGKTIVEAPGNLTGMQAPRTPGLGERASMPELVQSDAVPGSKGVTLTDRVASPAELYSDMFKLSQQNGVEYALTKEGDDLVLRSGAPDKVRVPSQAEVLAHTHPFDPKTEMPQTMPSRADVNALNGRWGRNPDSPRPSSDIVWGPEPDQVTQYHATGIDKISDPTKGGLKPGRIW